MDGLGKQFLPSTPAFVRCRLSLISLGLIIALLCHRDVRAHADLDVASLNNAPPQPIMLHHNHRLRDLHHQNRRTAALAAEHTAEPEDESMPLDWNGLWSLIADGESVCSRRSAGTGIAGDFDQGGRDKRSGPGAGFAV